MCCCVFYVQGYPSHTQYWNFDSSIARATTCTVQSGDPSNLLQLVVDGKKCDTIGGKQHCRLSRYRALITYHHCRTSLKSGFVDVQLKGFDQYCLRAELLEYEKVSGSRTWHTLPTHSTWGVILDPLNFAEVRIINLTVINMYAESAGLTLSCSKNAIESVEYLHVIYTRVREHDLTYSHENEWNREDQVCEVECRKKITPQKMTEKVEMSDKNNIQ